MRIILNTHQTGDALRHITTLVEDLHQAHHELRTRFLNDRDGYPTSSLGGRAGTTNELDDDGTPIPQHTDPVGRLVVSRDEATDPIGNALASLVQHIHTAMRELEAAISDAARARPPLEHPDPDTIWCESHLRYGLHEARLEGNRLCRWCKREQAEQGKLPSRRLIDAHDRGVRITDKLRHEIAQRDRDDRARARKHRAA